MILVRPWTGNFKFLRILTHAFTKQLVDCLVPGPMAYMSQKVSFITTNYANRAECYRYHVLANTLGDLGGSDGKLDTTAEEKGEKKTNGSLTAFGLPSIKNAMVEWSLILGDSCRQIVQGKFTKGDKKYLDEVVVLTDSTLFLMKVRGWVEGDG